MRLISTMNLIARAGQKLDPSTNRTKISARQICGYLYLPAASILLLASLLKVHQLATTPFTENLIFNSRGANILFTGFELVAAFWLFSRLKSCFAKHFFIILYSCFVGVAAYQEINGRQSCGCFGVLAVPPLITLIIDLVILTCLIFWRPVAATVSRLWLATGTITSSLAMILMLGFQTVPLDQIGQVIDEGQTIVIEHEKWDGQPFPLREFLIGGDIKAITQSEWTVVLYHNNCPKCQMLIESALKNQLGGEAKKTAFIEVPPYESPRREDSKHLRWYRLSDRFDWFISAPVVLNVTDGVVEARFVDSLPKS